MKTWLAIMLFIGLSGCVTVTQNSTSSTEADNLSKAESRIALGLGYLENGNMIKARMNLEQALEYAPHYYRAMLSIAHYYDKVGEDEKAYQAYDDALRIHPSNGHVLNNYGAYLCKKGQYKQADEYFIRAMKDEQYYLVANSYENAGLCALKYHHLSEAKHYFRSAVEHDPQRVHSLLQLAKLEISSNELKQARIRLLKFHNEYGYQKPSLRLLVELEKKAGNLVLESKYRALLSQ